MSNINTDGLPPEMQQRIADIIQKAKTMPPQPESPHQAAIAQPQQPAAPVVRQPSLMDHTIALRQEVDAMRNEVSAMAQVVDAVGQAVGQLYATFQQTTAPTSYSATFQTQQPGVEDVSDY